jgi:actin-related protein
MEGHGHDKVIVIDNGTSFMKAGLAGDARPSVVFATLACNDDTPHNVRRGPVYFFLI